MTEVSGALGIEQLKKLPSLVATRRQHATYLSARLGGLNGITLPYLTDQVEHSFHQYSILVDLERFRCSRGQFVEELQAEGIEAAIHYPRALNQQPVFAEDNVQLPNCEWLAQRILSLPVHPSLSTAELDRVANAVIKVARSNALTRKD